MRQKAIIATAFATLVSTSTFAADLPGKGITVQPIQSTISEESFQTQLVARALEKLGYTVNKPAKLTTTSAIPPLPLAMQLLPP